MNAELQGTDRCKTKGDQRKLSNGTVAGYARSALDIQVARVPRIIHFMLGRLAGWLGRQAGWLAWLDSWLAGNCAQASVWLAWEHLGAYGMLLTRWLAGRLGIAVWTRYGRLLTRG